MKIFNTKNNPENAEAGANVQKNEVSLFSQRTVKIGGFNFAIIVIVLAIALVLNIFVSVLPENITQLDASSSKLYSLTADSKVVVNALTEDVDIYWISQSGSEDDTIEKLLGKYEAQSSHITVTKKNPDIYPTFASQYTDGTVYNNDIIVCSGDKYRYISMVDIYEYSSTSYYDYGSQATGFDGEGLITSAINYVVSDELPKMYITEGHGEQELSEALTKSLTKANIEFETISLVKSEIPEDCDILLINGPESDLSENEVEMIETYVAAGGKLIVFKGTNDGDALENISSLMSYYGIELVEGLVIEEDSSNYAFQTPFILIPELQENDINTSLIEGKSNVIVPIAMGAEISEDSYEFTVTKLMCSYEGSFSKIAGYDIETYDKEDGDTDGPFAIAAISEDYYGDGEVAWVGSSFFLDDTYNSYSSNANSEFFSNLLSDMIDDTTGVSIPSKSLSYNYLTFTESQAATIKTIVIFIIPLIVLLMGVITIMLRRRGR